MVEAKERISSSSIETSVDKKTDVAVLSKTLLTNTSELPAGNLEFLSLSLSLYLLKNR